jgi:environmental stress-induced protein Ves
MHIVRHSSFVAVPWKNGGGVTHEAIRVPPGGEPFHWRVSVAQIDVSGPFSDFAAYNRFMVLLKGAGVVLKFSGGPGAAAAGTPARHATELRRVGDMAQFDGGLATHCDLVDGPCVDLNLMVSKTLPDVRARVEAWPEALFSSLGDGESMLVFPIDAPLELRSGASTYVLEPWDLAVLSGREDRAVRLSARGPDEKADAVKIFLATLPVA